MGNLIKDFVVHEYRLKFTRYYLLGSRTVGTSPSPDPYYSQTKNISRRALDPKDSFLASILQILPSPVSRFSPVTRTKPFIRKRYNT